MSSLARSLRLVGAHARLSLLIAMQYRADFLVDGAMSIFWTVTALVPLYLVFQERTVIAGWTHGEALVVVGWFTFLDGVLKGAINPSLSTVIDHIRKGTLDFVLLKPADAQLLVSTARFAPWRLTTILASGLIFGWAFHLIGRWPSVADVALSVLVLGAALAILYSLWIVVIAVAFRAVRIDNLRYLFEAVFDAARWPASVFEGAVSFLFTFVIPLAVMTTYPARALLGTLDLTGTLTALALGVGFTALSRLVWTRSIRTYSSASS